MDIRYWRTESRPRSRFLSCDEICIEVKGTDLVSFSRTWKRLLPSMRNADQVGHRCNEKEPDCVAISGLSLGGCFWKSCGTGYRSVIATMESIP